MSKTKIFTVSDRPGLQAILEAIPTTKFSEAHSLRIREAESKVWVSCPPDTEHRFTKVRKKYVTQRLFFGVYRGKPIEESFNDLDIRSFGGSFFIRESVWNARGLDHKVKSWGWDEMPEGKVYNTKTVKELKVIAKEKDLKNYSKLKKDALIDLILSSEIGSWGVFRIKEGVLPLNRVGRDFTS